MLGLIAQSQSHRKKHLTLMSVAKGEIGALDLDCLFDGLPQPAKFLGVVT